MAKLQIRKMKAADIEKLLAKSTKIDAATKAAAAELTKLKKGIGGIGAVIGKSAGDLDKLDD